jgi:hypothetical protein
MAKRIALRPEWLKAKGVVDIYSVADCNSADFCEDCFLYWKHNHYGFFNSPNVIREVAHEDDVDLEGTRLFYYEAYELEYHEAQHGWNPFSLGKGYVTNVVKPGNHHLEGYDIVTFSQGLPEHSPLSCNHKAESIPVNEHCLLDSFEDAKRLIDQGEFKGCEPGFYRVIAVYSIKEAKGSREIWEEEQAAADKKGMELFETIPFRDSFIEHFEISGIQVMCGTYYRCSLEGATWTADLKPRKELKHKARICLVLPIVDDKRLEVSITPKDILGVMESAFEHPFIAKRFETGGATGIRLRTQGDRLHWNTPELVELLTKITANRPKEADLSNWADLIIDAGESQNTSVCFVYFNTLTREIIGEDWSNWPSESLGEPFLLDATGKRTNARQDAGRQQPPAPIRKPDDK